jgi:hypothetical protein
MYILNILLILGTRDTYHGVMPLYALTHAPSLAEMVRGLIDIYRNEGFMPDCYMGMGPGYSQGGSNAEMPLVDFLLKHGPNYGDVSWEDGFKAMIKDATEVSVTSIACVTLAKCLIKIAGFCRNQFIKGIQSMDEEMWIFTAKTAMYLHQMVQHGTVHEILLAQPHAPSNILATTLLSLLLLTVGLLVADMF